MPQDKKEIAEKLTTEDARSRLILKREMRAHPDIFTKSKSLMLGEPAKLSKKKEMK